MLKSLFRKFLAGTAGLPGAIDTDFLEQTADALTAPSALMQLASPEAKTVARYMQPLNVAEGTVFIKEGDEHNTGFMVLILSGEVTVESIVVGRAGLSTLTVLGPGSMHGDLGLIDGLPRSVSCTASTDLRCAILTREGLAQLLDAHPKVCAKLMMAVAMRIGERLRDNTEKLRKYVALTRVMQQEIDHLQPHAHIY